MATTVRDENHVYKLHNILLKDSDHACKSQFQWHRECTQLNHKQNISNTIMVSVYHTELRAIGQAVSALLLEDIRTLAVSLCAIPARYACQRCAVGTVHKAARVFSPLPVTRVPTHRVSRQQGPSQLPTPLYKPLGESHNFDRQHESGMRLGISVKLYLQLKSP
jgi:hypothetical protein